MSPNTRPPLTTRIRASFDGKRSKSEVTSPTTNGFPLVTQDPEALRQAIDQAINTESFQNAISASLAKLLKPSIKSALDTIQPVVEAVYNHEVLLRKTNQSVENILERLDTVTEAPNEDEDVAEPSADPSTPVTPRKRAIVTSSSSTDGEGVKQLFAENNARNDAKLSELSSSLDANSSKVAEIAESIAGINAALWPTREALDSLKAFSDHSNTVTSVMQAQLDQLSADVGIIMDSIGSDLGTHVRSIKQQPATAAAPDTSLLSSHTTKLDAISTDLAAIKGHTDTVEILKDISTKLEALKDNVQAGIASSNEKFATISPQIGNILALVEAHSSKLDGINPGDANTEVLAAIKKSNDSHAAHTLALGELKERGATLGVESALSSGNPETVAALQALATDLASLKENIEAGLATNNENVFGVGTKIDDVLTTLEAHRAADPSADILAALQKSNASHVSHAEALEEIKSINVASAPSSDGSSTTNLEPQIAGIIATLNSHTSTLDDIKSSRIPTGPQVEPAAGPTDPGTSDSNINTILSTLETHTGILNEIKDDVSAEILTILHNINEGHATQNTILSEIRESDMSDEILTALHALNDSHATHTAVLADLLNGVKASNESHASHAGVLDEIKSARNVEPGSSSESPTNLGGLDTQIGAIITTLEGQNATLSAIKDATNVLNESHADHTATLAEIKDVTAASNESLTSHSIVLGDLKYAAAASAGFHDSHAAALTGIKDLTSASNGFHNSHTASLGEIKEAVIATSGSHASHSADLAEIKDASRAANDLHASHITSLMELKATQPTEATPTYESNASHFTALETRLDTIVTTLEAQDGTLSDIKEATANPETLAAVKKSHELLNSHTLLFDSIKDNHSHEDILANVASLKAIIEESRSGLDEHGAAVKNLHDTTKASHSELSQAIGALALGGAAGASVEAVVSKTDDSSAEILEEVKAVRAIVEKSSTSIETVRDTTTSMAAQIDINHTTITTSITTLNDELKAELDASSTEIASSITALSGDVSAIELGPLSTAILECGKEVKGLNTTVEALDGSVKGTGVHVTGLVEGVHLNDKGLNQLKEHATIHNTASNISLASAEEPKEVGSSNGIPLAATEEAKDVNGSSVLETREAAASSSEKAEPVIERDLIPEVHEPDSEPEAPKKEPEPIEEEPTPTASDLEKDDVPIVVEEAQSAFEEHMPIQDEPTPFEDISHLDLHAAPKPEEELTYADPETVPAHDEPELVEAEEHAPERLAVPEEESVHTLVETEPKHAEPEAAPAHDELAPIEADEHVSEDPTVPEELSIPVHAAEEQNPSESVPEEAAKDIEEEGLPVEGNHDTAQHEEITHDEPASVHEPEIPSQSEEAESIPEEKEPPVEEETIPHDESTSTEEAEIPSKTAGEEPVPEKVDEIPDEHAHVHHDEPAAIDEPEVPTKIHEEEPTPEAEAVHEEANVHHEPVITEQPNVDKPTPSAEESEEVSIPEDFIRPNEPAPIDEPETTPRTEGESITVESEPIAVEESETPLKAADEHPHTGDPATSPVPKAPEEPETPLKQQEAVHEVPPLEEPHPSPASVIHHPEDSPVDEEDESALDTETASASTSAIASPLSPSFPGEGSSTGKKGKKGKKEKKEKKGKKDKKVPFVFDPDEGAEEE